MTNYAALPTDDLRRTLKHILTLLHAGIYDAILLPGQRTVVTTIVEALWLALGGATPEQAREPAVTVITLVEAGQFAEIVARTGELMVV